MNVKAYYCSVILLLLAPLSVAQETQISVDLSQGIPQDAHLAIYGQKNPERAYQQKHLAEVWQTFQDEKIAERFFAAVTSQVPDEDLEQARSVWDEVQTALEPINCEALFQAEEVAYAQAMESTFTQHYLLLVRLTSAEAVEFQRGFEQLFDLFAEWSEDKVSKVTQRSAEASFVMLEVPDGIPFRPTLVRMGDVVIFSTSADLAEKSSHLLLDDEAVSKFDDPRLAEALSQLPEPEDAIVIFDGRLMFEKLHGLGEFLRQQNPEGNEELHRWTRILDRIFDELTVLDYEVTVEYTEGQQNRVAVFGKLLPDSKDKLLYQAVSQGQPFEDWQTWVPADAEAYSLNTGINLHVVYERVLQFVREEFPESHEALDQLEAKQQEIDFHLDRDLLQAFSGEIVSVTVPVVAADGSTTLRSVTALRCHDSERIQELLNRGMDALMALPQVEAQQLEFVECEDLEGFQELHGAILNMFSACPVIGFHDGWMMLASSPAAAAKVIATRQGEAEAINQADSFQKFNLEVTGPVSAISYTDVGAAVRQIADTIDQIGAIAPIFVGMLATDVSPEDLQPIQEMIGLLPSVAKVVRKFDFIEEQLSVVREGPQTDTYRRDGVWLVRAVESEPSE